MKRTSSTNVKNIVKLYVSYDIYENADENPNHFKRMQEIVQLVEKSSS